MSFVKSIKNMWQIFFIYAYAIITNNNCVIFSQNIYFIICKRKFDGIIYVDHVVVGRTNKGEQGQKKQKRP